MTDRGNLGRLPYLAMGAGPPLLFLGGLSPVAGVPAGGSGRMERASLAPFAAAGRRAFHLNRRAGLTRGMTMAELAAEHADAIRGAFGEPVDVVGVSTGGSIAQQLAADHPDTVRRLVLVSTACRLAGEGKRLQRRAAARIRAGAERRALGVIGAALVPPGPLQVPAALLAAAIGPRPLSGGAADLSDLATTIEAEDGFDLARCAGTIQAPTLIVAGADDRFYPRELFAETAALIPGSRLELIAGRGHITVMWGRRYPALTVGFLTS
jgi:pimeloyl-ACP methyl ester carboxylesterase